MDGFQLPLFLGTSFCLEWLLKTRKKQEENLQKPEKVEDQRHNKQTDIKGRVRNVNLQYLPDALLWEMFTSVKSLAAIQATQVSFF